MVSSLCTYISDDFFDLFFAITENWPEKDVEEFLSRLYKVIDGGDNLIASYAQKFLSNFGLSRKK